VVREFDDPEITMSLTGHPVYCADENAGKVKPTAESPYVTNYGVVAVAEKMSYELPQLITIEAWADM
jgi:hypothetical protein